MEYKPLISIIIPTYNEGEDVRLSLDAAIGFNYPHKEIIVVDDSTDNTPDIVKKYEQYGVRLMKRKSRENGCCGARNWGIKEARGEIIVLLNADVSPPRDFLERILPHYENGVDYLLVWQEVANNEYLFPRFVEAEGNLNYDNCDWIEWTEGFSCRREAAIDVGMIPGNFPLPFCRDWLLGKRLGEKYRKAIDRSIIVSHIAPHTFRDFWRVRKSRGRFAFLFNFFIGSVSMKRLKDGRPLEEIVKKLSLKMLILRTFCKTIKRIAEICLVFPVLWRSFKISRYSPRKKRDIIPFLWANIIQILAFMLGEWSACFEVHRCKRLGYI
jgi:glycosyltransferase involved in cell wall biosynthesis